MIEIQSNIWINESDIKFQAVRSSGPGGQHVNKVSSKILLFCPLSKINGLSEQQIELLINKSGSYIKAGEIRISSQKHRSQYSNKLDAIEKLRILLQKALKKRNTRYTTSVPRAIKEKRLREKKQRSKIKSDRHFHPLSDAE